MLFRSGLVFVRSKAPEPKQKPEKGTFNNILCSTLRLFVDHPLTALVSEVSGGRSKWLSASNELANPDRGVRTHCAGNASVLSTMGLSLLITPGGHLRAVRDPESLPEVSEETAAALEEAFDRSSAEGLLLLASREFAQELPAALVFWRSLARQVFQAICHLGEEGFQKWKSVAAPAEEELALLAAEAPPKRGSPRICANSFRSSCRYRRCRESRS